MRRARSIDAPGGETWALGQSRDGAAPRTGITTGTAATGSGAARSTDAGGTSPGAVVIAQQPFASVRTSRWPDAIAAAEGAAAESATWCMAAQSAGMSAADAAAADDGTGQASAHAPATAGEPVSSRARAAAAKRRT